MVLQEVIGLCCPSLPCALLCFMSTDTACFNLPVFCKFSTHIHQSKVSLLFKTRRVMSLHAIQNLNNTNATRRQLIIAVIIILKHITLLRLSNLPPQSALTRADLEYREANMDSTIHEHLMASSQGEYIERFAAFIMATDIGWFILVCLAIVSHRTSFSCSSVFGRNPCASK
ncbi:hypothetical protein EI94DRAFT_975327 [Lactarius quietus]|nr:hypothetical protein EI94DRAFT_975327 [Lactarius quietus]